MRSVVICGSRRFKPLIREFAQDLIQLGVVVYEPRLYEGEEYEFEKLYPVNKLMVMTGLTFDHFHKIRCADVVYIYNKDGYVGANTTLEIGYATALDKPIYALSENDSELGRFILYRKVIPSARELLGELR